MSFGPGCLKDHSFCSVHQLITSSQDFLSVSLPSAMKASRERAFQGGSSCLWNVLPFEFHLASILLSIACQAKTFSFTNLLIQMFNSEVDLLTPFFLESAFSLEVVRFIFKPFHYYFTCPRIFEAGF